MNCPSCSATNPDGMRFCGMCGAPLDVPLAGRERRRVSIVFIDLAGFSSLTHGFDPELLRDLADEILTVIAGIVEDYDGYVDAFRGDGLIALFGAPHSHPDDAQRAVLAAAAGLRAIETIGQSKGYPLKGRAGVNTGIVIAGAVGSGRVKDYTVMGSAVNLAARLEAVATAGEVWVGPETYEATRHFLRYQPSPPIDIRGFPDVREAYRFTGSEQPRHVDPYAHLQFVGRRRELERLWQLYQEVGNASTPKQLWLVGEAGIGKTRLLEEFAEALGKAPDATVVWLGEQDAESAATSSWMQLAEQLFELVPGEDRHLKQQKVTTFLRRLFPGGDSSRERAILGSLRLIERRSRPRSEDPLSGKHKRRPQTHVAVAVAWSQVLLEVAAKARPQAPKTLLLVVDHRAEDAALEQLLEQLMASRQPVLILRTSRWRDLPIGAEALPLTPLNLDESLALLTQMANPLLEVASRSLVTQVGGIPAYILELGRALSITPTGSFSGSLASLLQARLDMLPPKARQLLAQAALVGERCWAGLLEELAPEKGDLVLEALVSNDMLIAETTTSIPGSVEYRFQSELLRNAVLRMVPFSDRPALHQRIASWLEKHAPITLSPLVGDHFREAGYPEAAYPHYQAAADIAVGKQDYQHAFRLYDQLLQLNLSPELMVQGSLAYVQAALSCQDKARALQQLATADEWLTHCNDDSAREFRQVYQQLREEVEALEIEALESRS